MSPGITIAMCCHNSAPRLPAALDRIARQQAAGVPWELLIIDNGSTDETARIAHGSWDPSLAPLRVISEPRLGIAFARQRALSEAAYDLVSFIDDDNWVPADWVSGVHLLMSRHPEVGILGCRTSAQFDISPPEWFADAALLFGVSPVGWECGDITAIRGFVFGAGMTVRKALWHDLTASGFRWLAIGRSGASLLSGDDTELCFAARLRGWRIWYDDRLSLQHFVPASRLTWQYGRRLARGIGLGQAINLPYKLAHGAGNTLQRAVRFSWFCALAHALLSFARHPCLVIRYALAADRPYPDLLSVDVALGRIAALWVLRSTYCEAVRAGRVLRAAKKPGPGNRT